METQSGVPYFCVTSLEEDIMTARIRASMPPDPAACGRIIYAAFQGIAARHGFPPGFPATEAASAGQRQSHVPMHTLILKHPRIAAARQRSTGAAVPYHCGPACMSGAPQIAPPSGDVGVTAFIAGMVVYAALALCVAVLA